MNPCSCGERAPVALSAAPCAAQSPCTWYPMQHGQPSGKESLILSTDVQQVDLYVCVLNNYHSVALYVCLVNKVCAVTCILFY